MKPARRFLFRGEAVGVAAHIRRPRDLVIPAQASVSLPIIGGRGFSAVNGGCFGAVLKFGSAVVSTSADYEPSAEAVKYTQGNHQNNKLPTKTRVSTEVFDLSIDSSDGGPRGHTLTVARLAASMESWHPREPGVQPKFTTRLEIDGLAIDGQPIDVEIAHDLLAIETYEGLYKSPPAGKGGRNARDKFKNLFEPWPTTGRHALAPGKRPDFEVFTGCSNVQPTGKSAAKLATVISPNRIYVRDFGTIYLAEMIVSAVDRRLALMRIEMGSPVGGEVLIGGLGLDGHDWPP